MKAWSLPSVVAHRQREGAYPINLAEPMKDSVEDKVVIPRAGPQGHLVATLGSLSTQMLALPHRIQMALGQENRAEGFLGRVGGIRRKMLPGDELY